MPSRATDAAWIDRKEGGEPRAKLVGVQRWCRRELRRKVLGESREERCARELRILAGIGDNSGRHPWILAMRGVLGYGRRRHAGARRVRVTMTGVDVGI